MVIIVNGVSTTIISAYRTETTVDITVESYDIAKDLIHDNDTWYIDDINLSNYNKRGDTTVHSDGTATIRMYWTAPTYEELVAQNAQLTASLSDAVNALNILGVQNG